MDGKREVKEIVQALTKAGWRREIGGSGHWKAYPPDPSLGMDVLGNSISDTRALDNIKARLKRKGFDYDRRNAIVTAERVPFVPKEHIPEAPKPVQERVLLKTPPLHAFVNQLPDGNSVMTLYITSAVELVRIKVLLGLQEVEGLPKPNPYVKKISGPQYYTHSVACTWCGEHTMRKRPERPGETNTCVKTECKKAFHRWYSKKRKERLKELAG